MATKAGRETCDATFIIDRTERGGIRPGQTFRPGRFTYANSSAVKGRFYGTRTFAAWNGGPPFKYNVRIEATWLVVALSWLTSVIPSKAVAFGYV